MLAPALSLLLAIVAPGPAPAAPTSTPTPTPPPTVAEPEASPVPAPPAEVAPAPAPEPAVIHAPITSVAPPPPVATPEPVRTPPPEFGPFFVAEPVSETAFPNGPRTTDPPRFSLGGGSFCFVDDARCKSALILTADIGIGVNIVGGTRVPDLPYAQFTFRGGLVFKPLTIGRKDAWHPWGIGLLGSWSRGTGAPSRESAVVSPHTDTWRVLLVNQLWLSKRRNGFHLDLDLGIIRSTVLGGDKQFTGSSAGVSANWGGWGGIFLSGDFLDHDTRVVFGFRGHGIATAPAIGLILLGLLAGGALGGGQ
ncbi:MAG TPA: hypothetical protein VGB85_17290 [Nannocystis sp.]